MPGEAMYIIESGRVRITVTDADGREVILASLGHGDFFGEMAKCWTAMGVPRMRR